MKKIFLTSLIFLVCSFTFAQAPDTLWTKTFGGIYSDVGYSVQQTSDGGYIIIGNTGSFGAGLYDIWLIKTNDSGDTLWTKTFGGNDYEEGWEVQQTTDGGYVLIGGTRSFGAGDYDAWLIKIDSFGDTLWTKMIGGSYQERGRSIRQTIDGGYIITGSTESFGDFSNVWLIKTDSLGDTLWTKSFGGNEVEEGWSIQKTTDGGYIIVGRTESFGAGSWDTWLIKTDSLGDTLWTKTYGGTGTDYCYSIQQTIDGGYILTGYTTSFGVGSDDIWLIKTDSSGNKLWIKTFGGINSDRGYSGQQTKDGGYILTGGTASFGVGALWLIKTDSSGDTMWTKTLRDTSVGRSIQNTADGGYIIAGITSSLSAGLTDIYLLKTTPDVSNLEPNKNLIPFDFSLAQNYPNPFNPSTKISWQVPVGSWQTLKIYDVLGNEVATLVDEYKPAGSYEVEWNASELPSGVYFYQLFVSNLQSKERKTENYIETKKMVLLK
jgi:hypothetical protein